MKAFFFPHDLGARNDEKIVKLRLKEGWEGVGIFWAIVEKLYENNGYLEKDFELLAYELQTQCERIANVVTKYNLFTLEEEKFYNDRILENLSLRKQKTQLAQKSAKIRWNKGDANAMRTHSERNAIKERRGEDRKDIKESRAFAPPSLEEVINYCNERANQVNAQQFVNFYTAKGWMVGKNKMKDWHAAIRTWEQRDQENPKHSNEDDAIKQLKQKYEHKIS